jgi:hypothetical protein
MKNPRANVNHLWQPLSHFVATDDLTAGTNHIGAISSSDLAVINLHSPVLGWESCKSGEVAPRLTSWP